MKIILWLSKLTPKTIKSFCLKHLPIYLFLIFVLLLYGVKGMLITFFLGLFFFLGWIGKGFYQAFSDWRLTQRLNRVYFAQADYETLKRENNLLHEALKAFKENGKRGGPAAVRNDPQGAAPPRASINHNEVMDLMRNLRGDEI